MLITVPMVAKLATMFFALLALGIIVSSGSMLWAYGWDNQFLARSLAAAAVAASCAVWMLTLRRSRQSALAWFGTLTAAFLALGSFGLAGVDTFQRYQRQTNIWWQRPERIREYLFMQTAAGTSEQEVLRWLGGRGIVATIRRHHLEPNIEYPPTTTGGEAWTNGVLDIHGYPFETYIEVFYIFDGNGRLVDIGVRPSVNAL